LKLLIVILFNFCGKPPQDNIDRKLLEPMNIKTLNELSEVNKTFPSAANLYNLGNYCYQAEIKIEDFIKERNFKFICHIKIINSENYGDYLKYDGYHFKKLLKMYPQSEFSDRAEYILVDIKSEGDDFTDLKILKNNLEKFIKKYPKSDLVESAQKRIDLIRNEIEQGVEFYD